MADDKSTREHLDSDILGERTLRHRRNVLAISFVACILAFSPDLKFADMSIFGLKFNDNVSVANAEGTVWLVVLALLLFQLLSFCIDAYFEASAWLLRAKKLALGGGYLWFVLRRWPPEWLFPPVEKKSRPDSHDYVWHSSKRIASEEERNVGDLVFNRGWVVLNENGTIKALRNNIWWETYSAPPAIISRTRNRVLYLAWLICTTLPLPLIALWNAPWCKVFGLLG